MDISLTGIILLKMHGWRGMLDIMIIRTLFNKGSRVPLRGKVKAAYIGCSSVVSVVDHTGEILFIRSRSVATIM